MDRGPIVAQSRVALTRFDTLRSMQRKVYAAEPDLVLEALERLAQGEPLVEQIEAEATEYPGRRTPEDSKIDPTRSIEELFDFIRACDPVEFPAFFYLEGQKVCVKLWRPDKPEDEEDTV
jgi:methionyl-tRNA formyltransferase